MWKKKKHLGKSTMMTKSRLRQPAKTITKPNPPGFQTKPNPKVENEPSEDTSKQNDLDDPPRNSNQSLNKKSKEAEKDSSSWDWLTWILSGLFGLIILGGMGFLAYFIFGSIKRRRIDTDQKFNAVKSRQLQISSEVESLKRTISSLSGQVSQQQQSVSALKRKLGEVDNIAPPIQQSYTPSEPKPEFPVMADEYLAKNRSQSTVATVDSFTGNLIEDSDGNGEFCLIRSGNSTLALPSVSRFSTRSDYLNFYQNYYRCDRPAGGDIWIKSPAKVQKTESGWQLIEKGELEVR